MAVRTNSTNVEAILGDHFKSGDDLTAFIATASALVDWVDDCDTDGLLDSTTLELIERWLSAHYYLHSNQILSEEKTGKASGKYQGQTGFGLKNTIYGQAALSLDVSGCLAKRNEELEKGVKSAGLEWLGTDYETQFP